MASTSIPMPTLTDDEPGQMLALMKDSDSVELKATVPESAHRPALVALGIDPLEVLIRQIYSSTLPVVSGSGVVVRARRIRSRATARW